MGNDLPDYQSSVSTGTLEASSLVNGADAAKSASPAVGDVYLATDTQKLYVCVAAGAWTGFDAAILVQGILTLYENMVGNSKKITGLAAPANAGDAARIDELDDISGSDQAGSRAFNTAYQNGSKIRIIVLTYTLDSDGYIRLYSDANSNPTTEIGRDQFDFTNLGYGCMITFVVQPSHYWKIADIGATGNIEFCWEYDLLEAP